MAWFEDLTPYTYWDTDPEALNVGWLDSQHEFPVGDVPSNFSQKLAQLCVRHMMNTTRGYHVCQSCIHGPSPEASRATWIDLDGEQYLLGSAEIRITHADGTVFAAPNLVAHYVMAHRYSPPPPFVEAVLADPRV